MARRETVADGLGSKAVVVDLIRSEGPISRVELTAASGLTQPTISNIVRRLLNENIIRESGRIPSLGGKPRTLLEINASALYGIGIQLGFESMSFVATGVGGGVIARQLVDGALTDAPETVADRAVAEYGAFLHAIDVPPSAVAGVAVVVPGPLSVSEGTMLRSPALPGWENFPLRARLSARLKVPVSVDNDAAAAAVGEYWTRRVSREETFATIYMGTGIGAGVVLNGALFRGASSNSAELGHISIDTNGRECFCGNRGCVERYASPRAVLDQAKKREDELRGLDLTFLDTNTPAEFDRLARAANAGHSVAKELIEDSAHYLAAAAVSFSNIFDLDEIVLSGPAFAVAGSLYVRSMRQQFANCAFARQSHGVRIDLAINPRDSAAIGAASMVLQESIAPVRVRSANG